MHCHCGFLAIFGTIKQQGIESFWGILPLDPYQGPATDPLKGVYSVPQAPAESGNDLRS